MTITGTGFSATATDNTVVFLGAEGDNADNAKATVSAATATSLTVTVPSGARTGRISVTVRGHTGTSSTDFTVPGTTPAPAPPVVSSFSPTEGAVDTEVTITGVNFSDVPSENEVRFRGVMAAALTSATTTSLVVLVPSGTVTGRISVTVGGQTGTSEIVFTVTPVVSSFTPTSGAVGTSVTISGHNFSTTAGENTVVFLGAEGDNADNAEATVSAATATSLTVTVPSGARTGRISVAVGGQTGTSNTDFTVRPPSAPTSLTAVAAGFDQIDLR